MIIGLGLVDALAPKLDLLSAHAINVLPEGFLKPFAELADSNADVNLSQLAKVHLYFSIWSQYNLNSKPRDVEAACAAYLICNPVPSEVWEFVPLDVYWQGEIYSVYKNFYWAVHDLSSETSPALLEFSRISKLGSMYKQSLNSKVMKVAVENDIKDLIPETSGRAGGKIHLDVADLVWQNGLTNFGFALLKKILTELAIKRHAQASLPSNERRVCEFESVALIAMLLTDQMSKHSWMHALMIYNNLHHILNLSISEYAKLCKTLHAGARMTHSYPGFKSKGTAEDARHLYGLDTLPGRSGFLKLDTHKEMEFRMIDPAFRRLPVIEYDKAKMSMLRFWSSEEAYYNELDYCMKLSIKEVIKRDVKLEDFATWYGKRMFWAASGSAPGAMLQWDHDNHERLNKRGALLLIPASHYKRILEEVHDPLLWSKASTKFENGKLRAIWNTAIEMYIFQSYLLDHFERHTRNDTWDTSAQSLPEKFKSDIKRLYALLFSYGLMWDYSDFNINHTHKGIGIMYGNIGDSILEHAIQPSDPQEMKNFNLAKNEIKEIADFVRKSHQTVILENPLSGRVAIAVRSLLSGERGTSFTNTYMSRTYTHMVNRWIQLNLSVSKPLLRIGYHLGDDVFETTSSILMSGIVCIVYNLLGFAGQLYKITSDYGGNGEYLRLNYNADQGRIAGYPIRSFMGMIAGEFFREFVGSAGDRVVTLIDQYAKVLKRGGRPLPGVFSAQIKRLVPMTYTDEATGVRHRVQPPVDLVLTPKFLGGFGVSATKNDLVGYSSPVSYLSAIFRSQQLTEKELRTSMIIDLIPRGALNTVEAILNAAASEEDDIGYETITRVLFNSGNFFTEPYAVAELPRFSGASVPDFEYPRPPKQAFFSGRNKAKLGFSSREDVIVDHTIYTKAGLIKELDIMHESILNSALGGAYRANDLSNAAANYARQLEAVLKTKTRSRQPYKVLLLEYSHLTDFVNHFDKVLRVITAEVTAEVFDGAIPNWLPPFKRTSYLIDAINFPLSFSVNLNNAYGVAKSLVSAIGLSSWDSFNIYAQGLLDIRKRKTQSESLTKYEAVIEHHMHKIEISEFKHIYQLFKDKNIDPIFLELYLEGNCDLFPSPASGLGTIATSVVRSLVLHYLETNMLKLKIDQGHNFQDLVFIFEYYAHIALEPGLRHYLKTKIYFED